MNKLIILTLVGEFSDGFQANLTMGEEKQIPTLEIQGNLPSMPEISQLYQDWYHSYRRLDGTSRIKAKTDYPTNVTFQAIKQDCQSKTQAFHEKFTHWLQSETFTPIREKYLEQLTPNDHIRLLIRTNCRSLQRLPWYVWDLVNRPNTSVSFSSLGYESVNSPKIPIYREKVKVLAILGDSTGIDVAKDRRLLEKLPDADITFLVEPQRTTINEQLWEQQWDMLFFSGHSCTQEESGRIYLNSAESLTIGDLKYGLQKAIAQGLQLAIFNSCEGLGLAWELESLQIPQVIVMREPVADYVANQFLKYFLKTFAQGQRLDLSIREARERLYDDGLDQEYPSASLLPILYLNGFRQPSTWQTLGLRPVRTCPYRGLFAFKEEEAPFFFGRENFSQQIREIVQQESLVTIIGPSGSGKSSVVFAGLIPQLRTTQQWQIYTCRPSDRPFHNLASIFIVDLEPHLSNNNDRLRETRKLAADFREDEQSLRDTIEQLLWQKLNHRFLLVIDQFEEIYTLAKPEIATTFVLRLLNAIKTVNQSRHRLTVVLTLRADFLGKALSDRAFADFIADADQMLGPMNRVELESAILQPAALFGVTIEEGLTQRLLNEISLQHGSLPLLEFALTLLWEKQENAQLTHKAYEAIGGVKKALANYAEQIYAQLNPEEQERSRRILLQLVKPGEGTPDTRRLATRQEIGEENWPLMIRLADLRLVTTNMHLIFDAHDHLIEKEVVELVHEALIEEWFRLRTWLDLDREFRLWQERLREYLGQWHKDKQDPDGLLRGTALNMAENWLKERPLDLSTDEQVYIQLSIEVRDQQIKTRNRRRKFTIFGLSLGLVVVSGLAGTAIWFQQIANQSLEKQIIALSRSSHSLRNANQEFDSLIGAMRAAQPILQKQIKVKSETLNRVISALQWSLFQAKEKNRLEGHQNEVRDISFSPDGQLIGTASFDKSAKIWSRQGELLHTLTGHQDGVNSISFSPDGQRVATTSYDQTVKVWTKEGKLLRTLKGHTDWVYHVAFHPHQNLFATASKDRTVRLWFLEEKIVKILRVSDFKQGDGGFNWVTFSPDGLSLAASSWDGTVRRWTIEGKQLPSLVGHENAVNGVTFSPDGQMIATASADQTIKLWNLEGKELKTLKGHHNSVSSVAFSPDSRTLVSGSFDKTIKLWTREGEEIQPHLTGHTDSIQRVIFSPDGQLISSASFDKTAKLWDFIDQDLEILNGHQDNVWGVAFSPDGKTLATVGGDHTIRLWTKDGQLKKTFTGHQDTITSVNFSPDGQMIATTSFDQTIKLWTKEGRLLRTLQGYTEQESLDSSDQKNKVVDSLSFSPDGKMMATTNWNGVVKLWNLQGKEVVRFQAHSDRVYDINFSPDSQIIATASRDRSVKFWNLQGQLIQELPSQHHLSQVFSVNFSPNGQMILTSGRDGTVKLWTKDYQLITILSGHKGQVYAAKFSPDSQFIATSSADKTVKLWNLEGRLLKTFSGHKEEVDQLNFSPDGSLIASASRDDTVILWNIAQGQLKNSENLWNSDLNHLFELGCQWLGDYLKNNSTVSPDDKSLCNLKSTSL